MGNWFSSSRPSSPAPTLTSIQPLPDADDTPATTPRSPTSTFPSTFSSTSTSAPDDDSDMYRRRYGRNAYRHYNFSSRYGRNRRRRFSRRHPWYTVDRWRPCASDRDRVFWVGLDDDNDGIVNPRPRDEPENDEPEVPAEEIPTKLHVEGIDLHIEENSKAHHTDNYACNDDRTRDSDGSEQKAELVVRRGQEFKLTIHFDRPYDLEKNDIKLTFNLGDDYKPNKNLNATFKVEETGGKKYKPNRWGATKVRQAGNSLTVEVFMPASCPIGEWECGVITIVDDVGDKKLIWQYNHNQEINIIFNPWCKEDLVYLDSDDWRIECVLNDTGAIYTGNYRRYGARSWNFGQFEDGILDAAYHLIRKCFGYRASPGMGNPVLVSRLISKIVNSIDDQGVLMGNWSGDYEGGIRPTKWTGSVKILRQYMDTRKPVKYGQCWVFSAVVTTVCRAIGLPCRSVTNFASAHNTDKLHLSVDEIIEKGETTVTKRDDSIWNFHVWNEVWCARPDISEKNEWDGWQVIDATPQETSEGVYCCGPAPVKAIKEGDINIGYDCDFVFSEVNADKVTWRENESGRYIQLRRQRSIVGKKISTVMATGRAYRGASLNRQPTETRAMTRLDLTDTYKYDEESQKERQVYRKAQRKFRKMYSTTDDSDEEDVDEDPEPLAIEITDPGDIFVGNGFKFVANVTNCTPFETKIRDVTLTLFHKTYFDSYTGQVPIKVFEDVTIPGGEVKTFEGFVDEKTTLAQPQNSYNFELDVKATLFDSRETISENCIFRLRRPDIELKGPETCSPFDTIEVEAIFTNPLSVTLTECEIEMEGGFHFYEPRSQRVDIRNIPPGGTWRNTLVMKPRLRPRNKDRELSISFDSTQLQDVIGYFAIEMKY